MLVHIYTYILTLILNDRHFLMCYVFSKKKLIDLSDFVHIIFIDTKYRIGNMSTSKNF